MVAMEKPRRQLSENLSFSVDAVFATEKLDFERRSREVANSRMITVLQ